MFSVMLALLFKNHLCTELLLGNAAPFSQTQNQLHHIRFCQNSDFWHHSHSPTVFKKKFLLKTHLHSKVRTESTHTQAQKCEQFCGLKTRHESDADFFLGPLSRTNLRKH